MPIPVTLRKKIDQAIKRIEKGEDSYGRVAKRLGVGKATVYRRHMELLTKEVARLQKEKGGVQADLKSLERKYGDLETKYKEKGKRLEGVFQKRRASLQGEIKKLKQEKGMIKKALEAQGLNWDEGVEIAKDVKDLRAEKKSLKAQIVKHKQAVSNWTKKSERSRSTLARLKRQLSNLRGILKKEEGEFHNLMDQVIATQGNLLGMKDEKRKLEGDKRREEMKLHQLQEKTQVASDRVKQLERRKRDLLMKVKKLETSKEKIKKTCQEIIDEVELRRNIILKGAREKREKILGEAEVLRKEIEELKAEKEFLDAAITEKIEKFKEAREKLEMRKAGQVIEGTHREIRIGTGGDPLETLSQLPKLPLLRKAKKKAKIASTRTAGGGAPTTSGDNNKSSDSAMHTCMEKFL